MDLFGVNISFGKNGKYVKHEDCSKKHEDIKEVFATRIEDLKTHIDTRFEDYKDFILKNGK